MANVMKQKGNVCSGTNCCLAPSLVRASNSVVTTYAEAKFRKLFAKAAITINFK